MGIGPAGERRLTALTAQNVLFALGGLLLVVAAAVFTAVAWAQVGVAGRAGILALATAAVLAVPFFAVRRGLTGAAETFAAVGLLMILLDGYAAWAVDFLGVTGLRPSAYAAVVAAATSGIALGYGRLVGLPGPRICALVIAQPVFPLIAAAVDAGAAGWSLAFTGATVVNLAALWRLGFARSASAIVAYICGFVAAFVAALIAVAGLGFAGTAGAAAASGGALVLVAAVVTAGAVLAGNRIAQSWAAGALTVAVSVAAGGWLLRLSDGTEILRLSAVALVVAAAVWVLRSRLPEPVGQGPWIAALGVSAVPALGAAASVLVAASNSVAAAQPVFGAPWRVAVSGTRWPPAVTGPGALETGTGSDVVVAGPGWDLVVAVVVLLGAFLLLLPARFRVDLGLIAVAAIGFLVPAAFGLTWWSAAIVGMFVSAIALALATREPRAVRLVVTVAAAAHALVTGFGAHGVAAGVCAAIAVLGVGTALVVRHEVSQEKNLLGKTAMTVGLLAVAPAVWLALLAAEISATAQVRVLFAVTVLLGLAARRARGYEPQATGVALVLAATTPLWSLSGDDPAQLYVGAALVLVATLRTAPLVAVAASALVVGLLAWIADDLVALLNFGEPSTPPVSWATVAAVLMSAVAAWLFAVPAATKPQNLASLARMVLSLGQPGADAGRVGRAALWAASPLVALAVPLAFAAAGAPWPSTPLSQVVAGLCGLVPLVLVARWPAIQAVAGPAVQREPAVVAGGIDRRRDSAGDGATARFGLIGAFGLLAATGVGGATARPGAMLAAFALVAVAAAIVGAGARELGARLTGWVAGCSAMVVVAYLGASDLAGLEPGGVALTVLAAAAVAMVLEWVLAAHRPREALAVTATAQATALIALLIAGSTGRAALIATLWATVLAVRALRPAESSMVRFRYALAAAGCALIGWWLFLSFRQAGTVELYTAPAAALALLAGWWARRSRPELPSWTAYGPALAAGFLPTLAVIANGDAGDPQYARRLLLGVAGLAVLVFGALARLQAPVVSGGIAVVLIALHELAQVWDLVPRWVPLAVGGLLLVGVATTLEQRRRDLSRLRDAVNRMN